MGWEWGGEMEARRRLAWEEEKVKYFTPGPGDGARGRKQRTVVSGELFLVWNKSVVFVLSDHISVSFVYERKSSHTLSFAREEHK